MKINESQSTYTIIIMQQPNGFSSGVMFIVFE